MTDTGPANNLHAQAARILTEAARRRSPDGMPCEFAEFLAEVLAATAPNVGGPDRLLAGRPGSWEASHCRALLEGTLGTESRDWPHCRTDPLIVPLSVAELIEGLGLDPGLLGLDDALTAVDEQRDSRTHGRELGSHDPGGEPLTDRYVETYREYGEMFVAAVKAAADTIRQASVPVVVEVDADPCSPWWGDAQTHNPDFFDCEPMVDELWRRAHGAVPLPNVDIEPGVGHE